jgi:Rubrerythrin.
MDRLDYAIKMEREVERYYRELADQEQKSTDKDHKLPGNEKGKLRSVFLVIADEEKTHADLLRDISNHLPYILSNTHSESKNIFDEVGKYKIGFDKSPEALIRFRTALEKEEECIRTYREYLSSSNDSNEREILQFIIEQEEDHMAIFQGLLQ